MKEAGTTGGTTLAFIIVSAHQMTDSRMRTIRARPLVLCAGSLALVAMTACVAAGYVLGQSQATGGTSFVSVPSVLDFRRPEGQALVDRVGSLSGRLTRLEIEAQDLAKRLGVRHASAPVASAPAAPVAATVAAETAPDDGPSGGPLLPVDGSPASASAANAPVGDYGTGLSHLETEIDLLEASLEGLADVAAARDLTDMAYPNRVPVLGNMPHISSGFGVRRDPFTGRLAHHTGLDIPAAQGTAILASGGGRVTSAGFRGAYGNAIVIDHGNGLQTLYGHCSRLFVHVGDLVMPRQKIAAVGSTGRSTGPHLHFEVIRDGVRVEPGRILASVLARNAD
jgi:murein DD-endopeptidase MepM/ murein hydrolase activator NlpD